MVASLLLSGCKSSTPPPAASQSARNPAPRGNLLPIGPRLQCLLRLPAARPLRRSLLPRPPVRLLPRAGTAGAAFTGSKQIMLPAETLLTFKLDHSVHIVEQNR